MKVMNYSYELSLFDTEIFGFKTAKINHINSSNLKKTLSELKTDLLQQEIAYATYRIEADNFSLIHTLEENGFILVDGLITLEINIAGIKETDCLFIKEAAKMDHPQLIDLSGNIFRGVSRYYHDQIIASNKADAIYKQWMKNSLAGKAADIVLVWRKNNEILGFITLQKKGSIPLIAVSKNARGKGIGKALIFAALNIFKKWELDSVSIDTQITNIPALRLYHSCGFKISSSRFTLRWCSL